MNCPFCKFSPPGPEPLDQAYAETLLIDHVAERHCGPVITGKRIGNWHKQATGGFACFCGRIVRNGPMNAALRKHLEECGGLDAHAQDHLMGINATPVVITAADHGLTTGIKTTINL